MVIHRDLKPANVLFLTDQSGVLNTVKIIDFGVAICLDPSYATDLFENKTVGTLNYMAPEQLVGKECYESDAYSLGAIMYTLLAGRVPLITEEAKNIKEKDLTGDNDRQRIQEKIEICTKKPLEAQKVGRIVGHRDQNEI